MMRFTLPPATQLAPPEPPTLGRDIAFSGDLDQTPDGDWRTVEGDQALRQVLLHRLVTGPGEHAFRPDFGAGLRAAAKKAGSRAALESLRQRVLEQLRADDRVRSVPAVSVVSTERGVRVTATVSTSGETITLKPLEVTG